MRWRYDKETNRLLVWNDELELISIRRAIMRGMNPNQIEAIVYETPTAVFLITGRLLRGWLDGRLED